MKSQISHIALLTRSAATSSQALSGFGYALGKPEDFEGEGTRELYIEIDRAASLLLMEAISAGPYQRALEKRGPGLHHIAIRRPGLEASIPALTAAGWKLLPVSEKSIPRARTAWLSLPGFPGLLEVQEGKAPSGEPFVTKAGLPLAKKMDSAFEAAGLTSFLIDSPEPAIWIGERKFSISALV